MSGRYEERDYGDSNRYDRRTDRSMRGGPQRRAGDWDCDDCGFHNYSSRSECFKCKVPKGDKGGVDRSRRFHSRSPPRRDRRDRSPPRSYGGRSGGGGGGYNNNDYGDNWDCPKCNFSNFAKRHECMKCRTSKSGESGGRSGGDDRRGGGPERREGDWNCKECDFSNFASRDACYKCSAPK
ncbi:RNA-binding protein cabeza-like [Bolinopsis microptera]|uniref:RNA-binding protein cabeza-like n=1 Tax=Bolinopsis microptera TaxID=2820187 RepID=UPI003078C804